MVNIYIASPFFSDDQVDRVQRVEQALTANKTVDKFFSPRLADAENLEYGTLPWRDFIFKNDIKPRWWLPLLISLTITSIAVRRTKSAMPTRLKSR